MIIPGGPRKEVSFPFSSVTFRKRELPLIMETLNNLLQNSLANFGDSASFQLNLSLQNSRRDAKEKSCQKKTGRSPHSPQSRRRPTNEQYAHPCPRVHILGSCV